LRVVLLIALRPAFHVILLDFESLS
jgi:hypothetical protein